MFYEPKMHKCVPDKGLCVSIRCQSTTERNPPNWKKKHFYYDLDTGLGLSLISETLKPENREFFFLCSTYLKSGQS